MKELSLEKLENLEGGKFWGWSDWDCSPMSSGRCHCVRTHRVFWIRNVVEHDIREC